MFDCRHCLILNLHVFYPCPERSENYDKSRFKIALNSVNCFVVGNFVCCNIFNLALKEGIKSFFYRPDAISDKVDQSMKQLFLEGLHDLFCNPAFG